MCHINEFHNCPIFGFMPSWTTEILLLLTLCLPLVYTYICINNNFILSSCISTVLNNRQDILPIYNFHIEIPDSSYWDFYVQQTRQADGLEIGAAKKLTKFLPSLLWQSKRWVVGLERKNRREKSIYFLLIFFSNCQLSPFVLTSSLGNISNPWESQKYGSFIFYTLFKSYQQLAETRDYTKWETEM